MRPPRDDALAELGSEPSDALGLVYSFLRERWSALLVHGVSALIAGRREQRTTARKHLREGLALPIENLTDRENRDFLVAAHALSLEQSGEIRRAMLRLIPHPRQARGQGPGGHRPRGTEPGGLALAGAGRCGPKYRHVTTIHSPARRVPWKGVRS